MRAWEQEQFKLTLDIEENDERYAAFPERCEINDYEIMEDFCYTAQNDKQRKRLLALISGKGAFRRFKAGTSALGINSEVNAIAKSPLNGVKTTVRCTRLDQEKRCGAAVEK